MFEVASGSSQLWILSSGEPSAMVFESWNWTDRLGCLYIQIEGPLEYIKYIQYSYFADLGLGFSEKNMVKIYTFHFLGAHPHPPLTQAIREAYHYASWYQLPHPSSSKTHCWGPRSTLCLFWWMSLCYTGPFLAS